MGSHPLGLLFLVGEVSQALPQAGGLAKPLHSLGLPESLAGVGLDLQQPELLGQVEPEHKAPDRRFASWGRGFGPTAIGGAAHLIVRFTSGHETTRDLVTLAWSTLLPLAWLVMVSRTPLQGGMTADAAPTWW
ncbi:hypothetical protein [Frankia sp. QA3]|uniref:hypothetical protein n=1 Tax=Frankia sp. QA3 TaxID=710111 RepID=UPI0012FB6D41|nr:hypothetical protein [Frankia sp. QA3]